MKNIKKFNLLSKIFLISNFIFWSCDINAQWQNTNCPNLANYATDIITNSNSIFISFSWSSPVERGGVTFSPDNGVSWFIKNNGLPFYTDPQGVSFYTVHALLSYQNIIFLSEQMKEVFIYQ